MTQSKHIVLIVPNCTKQCVHCSFGSYKMIDDQTIRQHVIDLQSQGHTVSLYELDPDAASFERFRFTKQYERGDDNPFTWLNITNSLPLTSDIVGYIRRHRIQVSYSLYGSTKERHALIAGEQNGLDETLRHVRKLRRLAPNNYLIFAVVVHRQNLDDVPAMIELAEGLGINELDFTFLAYVSRARRTKLDELHLRAVDIRRLYQQLASLESSVRPTIAIDPSCGPLFGMRFRNKYCNIWGPEEPGRYCGQGRNQLTIMLGSNLIFPCGSMAGDERLAIGKLEGGELVIGESWPLEDGGLGEPCHSCVHLEACQGGCRANAIFENLRRTGAYDHRAGQGNCFYACARNSDD